MKPEREPKVLRLSAYALTLTVAVVGCDSGSRALPTGESLAPDLAVSREAPVPHIIHDFGGGGDGATPVAGLISDATGALYGTTYNGGSTGCGGSGCGTVFKLTPSGTGYTETILHAFEAPPDGQGPSAGLVIDGTGAIYGTTYTGGFCRVYSQIGGCGTVFKLTPSGTGYTETVLYKFQHKNDGAYPSAKVVLGPHRELYGTTEEAGTYGSGTVFALKRSGSGFKVLYAFHGGQDGSAPVSGLLVGTNGTLFGTTPAGGNQCGSGLRCGTVYDLVPSSQGYTEHVLYRFRGGTEDGQFPESDLVTDKQGTLYGTTFSGGTGSCTTGNPPGCGTVFALTPSDSSYRESLLHDFLGGNDGAYPTSGSLVEDRTRVGVFYLVTQLGGKNSACPSGCGTVIRLKSSGGSQAESVLYRFQPTRSGAHPYGALIIGAKGELFGTTSSGGAANGGTAFRLKS